MPSPEKTGSSELDIAALHSEPEPEDKVLSTEDAVAKMKEESKLNLPAAGAGVSRPKGPEPALSPDKDKDKNQAPKGKQAVAPAAKPAAPPAPVGAPKQPVAPRAAHERAKTPEDKAEAYANYFKDVKTHEEFLRKVSRMDTDDTLRQKVGIKELEKVVPKVCQTLVNWWNQFQAHLNWWNNQSSKRVGAIPHFLIEFAGTIARELPSGFQSTLHRVVHEALMPTPPATGGAPSPAPVSAVGGEKPPTGGLSTEAILADMRALKARQAAAAPAEKTEVVAEKATAPAEKTGAAATPSPEKLDTLQFKAGDVVMHKDWKAPRRISFVKEEGGVQKAFAGSTTGVPLSELVASTPEAKPRETTASLAAEAPRAGTVPVAPVESAPSGLTSEEIAGLTFVGFAKQPKEVLAKIAATVPDDALWAVALQGMTTSSLEKAVQAALPPGRVDNFALEILTMPIKTKPEIEKAQKEIEAKAKEVFAATKRRE